MLRWAAVFGLLVVTVVGCVKTPPPSAPTLIVPIADAPLSTVAQRPFDRRFANGDRVEVLWNGRWWPAVVLESRTSRWLVHYEGYADDWDETVDADRIRERGFPAKDSDDDDDDMPEERP
jgi:hypothetical protein